jgi:hypothetical protein
MLGEFQDCLELDKLPEQLENLRALKCLHTSRIGSKQQPSSPKSSNIISLLPSIIELCSLTKLRELVLGGCNLSEDEFPIEFGCLPSLNCWIYQETIFVTYLGLSTAFLGYGICLRTCVLLFNQSHCTQLYQF